MKNTPPILFFDGHCNLCNSFIDFLVRNDPQHKIKIASLQGKTAGEVLQPKMRENMKSVVFVVNGQILQRSAAVFQVAKILRGPFLLLIPFMILPRFLTDWIYDCVATHRYKIFGKNDTCRIPNDEEKQHFLP